ncbi:universal stress protein [Nocardia flavorosea]|uniref:universal stress protein n=1 Tax=Nocardia flavorosea TaxID=53429 RepID=UPI00189357E9|nr:universal stress protein [Nocardia flavorosea]MBF6347639.1 universal stress protein [Nocardia flavorosea]
MATHSEPPIIVGIDGSPTSLDALRWAARHAALHRCPLQLVHAIGAPVTFGPEISVVGLDNQALRADGETILAAAEETARETAADLEITTTVADLGATTVLLDLSADARMVVVGTRGLGTLGRLLLGSVSTSLARHAHCPVAVIPDTEEPARDLGQRPVVVGVDGSPRGQEAVDIAFEEASRGYVGVIAVTTWSESFRYISRDEMQEQARALQAESLAGRAERYPDVAVTSVVAEDRPARRILAESENAQLIVVGSHGRGGFAGMTLGSVGQAVLHSTRVPLLIARARD